MAMNRMSHHPELFPCGDRVKLPQVGADATQLKGGGISLSDLRPTSYFTRRQNLLRKDYLQRISSDLVFSEDVVRLHAAHMLPFDENSFHCTYDCSDIVQCEKKPFVGVVGRYNPRNTHHHLLCHIKKRSKHRLEPLRKPKPKSIISKVSEDKATANLESKASQNSPTFLTEDPTATDERTEEANAKQVQTKYSQKWDEHLLMHLSKNTARWIVSEQTVEGPQKDKLRRMLEDIYGAPSSGAMDTLIHDDVSISEMSTSKETILTVPKGESKTSTVHQTADEATHTQDDTDIMEDKSKSLAAFYRQPDAIRRQRRQIEKELAGAINSTAREINVVRHQPKPPPTLKDVMNPGIGDKMYDTQNQFEQEWLSGAQQLLLPDRSHLLLDTGNLYQITRQEDYPHDPVVWCNGGTAKRPGTVKRHPKEATQRGHRGYMKWSQLPAPIQGDVSLTVHEAGYDPEALREPDPNEVQQYKQNQALLTLVDEWRTKWHLGNKWYESSIEDLVRDMSDIHEHVRLQAIATIAKAATYRPPAEPGLPIQSTFAQRALASVHQHKTLDDSKGVLPDDLLQCVVKALGDASFRVRITAAIALYTLNRPDDKAKQILSDVMRTGSEPERWAAAQCLAHAGICDSYVVGELVHQLLNSADVMKNERCVALLAGLSRESTVVHSMVAEQLNSTSWRHRIIACRVLPRLSGTTNKDITHKLSNLMWNDWHHEVRKAAAQTLGRTGHGKAVHDDLRDRLLTGNERDRIDALNKIAHLGIMTARLLPAYLQCFNDPYITVRITATNTASQLSLQDPKVTQKLLFLTQFDTNWKVKAHAIKALGDIGHISDPIEEAILWAVRFESEPGVRAEALQSLVKLQINDKHVAAMLQEKLLVEPDQLVRVQLAIALQSMGVSPTGDIEMVQQIKDEVRRLCTRYNIASKIVENERREGLDEQRQRFFDKSSGTSDTMQAKLPKDNQPRSSLSTKHSQRSLTTPSIFIDSEPEGDTTSDDENYIPSKPTPDIALPQTPSAGPDRASPALTSRTPLSTTSSKGRSPVEKLEKLIELYEGSCSFKEYQNYVRPDEDDEIEPGMKDAAAIKLETIAEGVEEEIRILKQGNTPISKQDSPRQDAEPSDCEIDRPVSVKSPTPLLDANSNFVLSEDEVHINMAGQAARGLDSEINGRGSLEQDESKRPKSQSDD